MPKHNHLRGASLKERLEYYSMPEPNSGCQLWLAGANGNGYARVWNPHLMKRQTGHVAAWEDEKGPVPDGLYVLHKCDVRLCINVGHLFLGTHDDNMKDMAAKGRGRSGDHRGELHGGARLSAQDILNIRADRRAGQIIADAYGISRDHVYHLRNGSRWKHVA